MRKVFIFLLVGIACTSASMAATYSYSVSGKVYMKGTTIPVSNAVVTHTIGSSIQSNTVSAMDGSFYFSYPTLSFDPVKTSMNLKASKGICTGATPWACNGYSEMKSVDVSCKVEINPNLAIQFQPAHFAEPGIQPPLTAAAYVDDAAMDIHVQQFNVVIGWNPAVMNLVTVQTTPGSNFEVTGVSLLPEPGKAQVQGQAAGGVPVKLPIPPNPPDSFFDVFFEVSVIDKPSYASVVVDETTELFTLEGPQSPYPSQTSLLLGKPEKCKTTFLIDEYNEWEEGLMGERPYAYIRPLNMANWEEYMAYWHSPETEKEGLPYPETTFVPCIDLDGVGEPDGMLYVWEGGGGGGGGALEDAGLVMAWKFDEQTEGNYASAWRYDYGLDPDLRNCTIQVTVTPPAPPPPPPVIQSHINAVSFSIVDVAGRMRTWWWAVPAAIPLGMPTTVKINTAIQGVNATTPVATGYMNVPGFNLAQSQFFDVDENFNYIFQSLPVPPPGQMQQVWAWNYWHNLIVTKNTDVRKWFYIKYSQKPEVMDDSQPPMINGWDELSVYQPQRNPIMADDWECTDDRPITDIHWWGSFIGWTQPNLPPVLPKAFHIGIWTDVAQNDPDNQFPYSHPGKLIWENTCTSWVWNFAGYDLDPRLEPITNEACFQFTQLLSENEWFHQDPGENVYWLSIAAIYDPQTQVQYPWGWKTRPHQFNDDAIRIQDATIWPPAIGSVFNAGIPVELHGESWDLAFELSTNEPKAPASADLNYSGFVDLADLAIFASQWLSAGV